MFNILIVEDEIKESERLKSFLEQISKESNNEFHISCFDNGLEVLNHYDNNYDLIFLDINMPKIDGMSLAKEIRKVDHNVAIVFVTNLANYAIDGYQVDAIDFILKPVNFYDFKLKMERISNRIFRNNDERIIVKTKDGEIGLSLSKIKYVEVMGHYLTFHTLLGNFDEYGSLKSLTERLSKSNSFVQTNRCFIINVHFIDSIKGNDVIIKEDKIPISRKYRKHLLDFYTNFLSGGSR